MPMLTPLPRVVTRPVSILILVAWIGSMAALVNRSYLQAAPANLASISQVEAAVESTMLKFPKLLMVTWWSITAVKGDDPSSGIA